MDQSATTQAYVSGWKESLQLNGNELVEFTTFFSIGYAIAIIPAQLIQTMLRPSLFLPVCEIIWGLMTMSIYACKDVKSVYAVRFFTGVFEATSWPGLVALIFNWCRFLYLLFGFSFLPSHITTYQILNLSSPSVWRFLVSVIWLAICS